MEMRFRQFHAFAPSLSRVIFVNFRYRVRELEWIERATPSVGIVEDRHVEHKHRIVDSTAARDHFSPFGTEISLLISYFCFLPVTGTSNVCFVS